jgi:hypothetical protein
MGAALEDAEFGMLEDARDVLPARRRRRPQLRLVKLTPDGGTAV